ncbi:Uncharacterised protein [Vibrio alginolyticus]|uniref:Uncharacterized protein n=1 Tax=Vibrio alginolyticus TaxID=663 RepID=A0ABX4X972_VIBAL|nr:hypothetical protein AL545_02800 [Vibrio alginolyticus]PNP20396.1 hypothetical protein AL553_022440 [Vibrio alginolyticus]SQA43558.1 Uncharacterised protein [Vibrio alginolyticus]
MPTITISEQFKSDEIHTGSAFMTTIVCSNETDQSSLLFHATFKIPRLHSMLSCQLADQGGGHDCGS